MTDYAKVVAQAAAKWAEENADKTECSKDDCTCDDKNDFVNVLEDDQDFQGAWIEKHHDKKTNKDVDVTYTAEGSVHLTKQRKTNECKGKKKKRKYLLVEAQIKGFNKPLAIKLGGELG